MTASLKRRIYGLPAMRWYRKLRAAQLASRPVETPYGFTFAGDPIYLDPAWEAEERKVIERLLPNISAFVDIGANHGIYSCLAAHAGAAVVAVEPEQGNLRVLHANLRQFPEAEILPLAVSDRSGVESLYGDGDTASLRSGWVGTPSFFRQAVRVETMDALFADRWQGQRILVKVDVEGGEAKVIAGAAQMLRRSPKPYWLIECFPGEQRDEFIRQFTETGYTAHPVDWLNLVFTDDREFSLAPVESMRFGIEPVYFTLDFGRPTERHEAVELVIAEASRRGAL